MDWQQRYIVGDTPWDKGQAAPALVKLLAERPYLFQGKREILVPGCGKGYDAVSLAEAGLRVTGVDIAQIAIDAAQLAIPVSLESVLRYACEDLFALPESFVGVFDMVWEHTCFCAISPADRAAYVRAMWHSLKPGGCVLGVFFTNPEMEPGEEGPPFKASRDEIREIFGELFSLEWEWIPDVFYSGREGRERVMLLRRLSVCGELGCDAH